MLSFKLPLTRRSLKVVLVTGKVLFSVALLAPRWSRVKGPSSHACNMAAVSD